MHLAITVNCWKYPPPPTFFAHYWGEGVRLNIQFVSCICHPPSLPPPLHSATMMTTAAALWKTGSLAECVLCKISLLLILSWEALKQLALSVVTGGTCKLALPVRATKALVVAKQQNRRKVGPCYVVGAWYVVCLSVCKNSWTACCTVTEHTTGIK